MNFKILILIISSFFFTVCSTGPDFERDNENDPLANNFVPNQPSTPNIYIDQDKNINLNWSDETNFEDGYLIKKQIAAGLPVITIDTLDVDVNTFIDTSKDFSLSTKYFIESFVIRNDSLITEGNNQLQFNFQYSQHTLQWITEHENTIKIYWNNTEGNGQKYVDGFLIELYSSNSPKQWIPYDTLKIVTTSTEGEITLPKPDSLFNLNLRLTGFIKNYEDQIEFISQGSRRNLLINTPTNVNLEIIDQVSAKLNWENISNKADGFIIEQESEYFTGSIDTLFNNTNSYDITFSPQGNGYHRFSIQPFINENIGGKVFSNEKSLFVNPPSRIQATHVNSQSLNLEWLFNEDVDGKAAGFVIHRKREDQPTFTAIDTVGKSERTFTDTNLNSSFNYSYKVTTYFPYSTDILELGYREALINEQVTPHGISNDEYIKSTFGDLIVGIDEENELINIYDSEYNNTIQIPLSGNVIFSNPNSLSKLVYEIAFNKDENLLAFTTASQSNEYWNYKLLHVYDLTTQSFLLKNSDSYPSTNRLVFSANAFDDIYISEHSPGGFYKFNTSDLTSQEFQLEGQIIYAFNNSGNDGLIYSDNSEQIKVYDIDTQESHNTGTTEGSIFGINHSNSEIYLKNTNSIYKYNLLTDVATDLYHGDTTSFFYLSETSSSHFFGYDNNYTPFLISTESQSIHLFNLTLTETDNYTFLTPIFVKDLENNTFEVFSHQAFHTFELSTGWSVQSISEGIQH